MAMVKATATQATDLDGEWCEKKPSDARPGALSLGLSGDYGADLAGNAGALSFSWSAGSGLADPKTVPSSN